METINLKCVGIDLSDEISIKKATEIRFNLTYNTLKKRIFYIKNVLCIGAENGFDKQMCSYFNAEYNYTTFDLNKPWPYTPDMFKNHIYDYVFCFEVLEHLMNPLLFLCELKKLNLPVAITYPRQPFTQFRGGTHFHEFPTLVFQTLLYNAGFKIDYHVSLTSRHGWWKFPKSFKKLISRVLTIFGYPKWELYIVSPSERR